MIRISRRNFGLILGSLLLTSVPALHAQCQDQTCYLNPDTRCYQCVQDAGLYCNIKIARCANECSEGSCDSGAAVSAEEVASCRAAAKLLMASYHRSNPTLQNSSEQNPTKVTKGAACQTCTGMAFIKDEVSPLLIIEQTHGTDDLLVHSVVRNVGNVTITDFRFGWMIVPRSASEPVIRQTGNLISPTGGIFPGIAVGIPSQSVPGSLAGPKIARIAFYIDEVHTADGKVFVADASKLESRARDAAARAIAHNSQ